MPQQTTLSPDQLTSLKEKCEELSIHMNDIATASGYSYRSVMLFFSDGLKKTNPVILYHVLQLITERQADLGARTIESYQRLAGILSTQKLEQLKQTHNIKS